MSHDDGWTDHSGATHPQSPEPDHVPTGEPELELHEEFVHADEPVHTSETVHHPEPVDAHSEPVEHVAAGEHPVGHDEGDAGPAVAGEPLHDAAPLPYHPSATIFTTAAHEPDFAAVPTQPSDVHDAVYGWVHDPFGTGALPGAANVAEQPDASMSVDPAATRFLDDLLSPDGAGDAATEPGP
jgi:hypothetical protein